MKYKKGNQKKKLVNSEVTRVKDNRRRELALILIFVFSIAALAMFYVWQRLENVGLAYQIQSLKTEYQKEKKINDKLQLQMEKLKSLSRIGLIAERNLGMRLPTDKEMLMARPVRVFLGKETEMATVKITGESERN